MIAALVIFAMYGSSFLPLLVLSLARVGKTEIWVLTGLTVLWLAGMAWLHGELYPAELTSPERPWLIAGACAALCVIWAAILTLLKKNSAPVSRPLQGLRP